MPRTPATGLGPMNAPLRLRGVMVVGMLLVCPAMARAQMQMHHHPAPKDSVSHSSAHPAPHQHATTAHDDMHGMDMGGMDMGAMPMNGMYGPYSMSREASGTAWQPEAARHEGVHLMKGPWMVTLHGFADGVYDNQGGPRGDVKFFGNNMGMAMAQR